MSMHIISPGMLTTVQDLGRCGYMASGFQQSGAMDRFAAEAANLLVDNSRYAFAVITVMGKLLAEENLVAAFSELYGAENVAHAVFCNHIPCYGGSPFYIV